MPALLSIDLRSRAVAAWEAGEGTQAEIAARFHVGEASIRRCVARKRRSGSLVPKVPDRSGVARLIDADGERHLRALVEEQADASEEELTARLVEVTGVVLSRSTVNRALRRMGLTRKKRRS